MFVVELAGLQAVVKLAEKSVEQVPLGLVVPVSGGTAGIVVSAGARGVAQVTLLSDGLPGHRSRDMTRFAAECRKLAARGTPPRLRPRTEPGR